MQPTAIQRFSTDQFPQRDQLPIWREVFGRQVFHVDIEAPSDSQFIGDATLHALPGLKLLSGTNGPGVYTRRTPELIGDGFNDFFLTVNRRGRMLVSQRGRDHGLEPGAATLTSFGEVGGIFRDTAGESCSLQIPRAALTQLVPNLDDLVMQPIPSDLAALRLLLPYLELLKQSGVLAAPELASTAARHICDLVILTIAGSPDALEVTRDRGVRAARLATIKADIVANIARSDLSAEMIAQRHGVSRRYIHRLFERDDRSFAQFVLEQKLSRAHGMLTDPGFAEWSIGAIAAKAGFAERSHFNRVLRLRYGASPSDLRATLRRGEEG
jgi:AraC-like DNA-binding protein